MLPYIHHKAKQHYNKRLIKYYKDREGGGGGGGSICCSSVYEHFRDAFFASPICSTIKWSSTSGPVGPAAIVYLITSNILKCISVDN